MSGERSDKRMRHPPHGPSQQGKQGQKSSHTFTLGVREKLITLFLVVKIVPLILLAFIAWQSLKSLGNILRETSVTDSRKAMTAMARENIERITTDTAQKVAEFLYQRDADISVLADYCGHHFIDSENSPIKIGEFLADFGENKTSLIRQHSDWAVASHGMGWVQTNPYVPPTDTQTRSVNPENEDEIDGTAFHYRPPFGFGDEPLRFVAVPLYDEIALLDKSGKQVAKHVSSRSTKKRFPFPQELLDISDPQNTFVKAERYFEQLRSLGKNGIYVSDVIGAYTPCRFIGMYTPNSLAAQRINSKIIALEKEADGIITETSWKLRVLHAELKNEEEVFNSKLGPGKKVRDEIDRRLGVGKTWIIENKTPWRVSEELRTLGFSELAEEILTIPFTPENEAFAGAENPRGIRFEGIVRWAKPVLGRDGEVVGYVTFALNHDHIMEMIDHIMPMMERYTELSDAFTGNYAFIWDYQCRNIVHPRHHSICGYNPETGVAETPWLESTLYKGMIAAGYDRDRWQDYIATLTDYQPWTSASDWVKEKIKNKEEWSDEEKARLPLAYQGRMKTPALELTKQGLVGLDGRYLNNAPQCTGWMNLTRDGGSGSFYILWSGLYKLTTAATIPYYTGQYNPEVQGNKRGFGFVTIGAGIDDFIRPANEMGEILETMVADNIQHTTIHLIWTTIVLSIIVVFIAVWMASYLSKKLNWLIDGITKFRRGHRNFRFGVEIKDEFSHLAHSFDNMAENLVKSVHTPMVITDMNLNILYANEQALQAMGTETDIFGQSYKERSIYKYGSRFCPITALSEGRTADVLYLKKSNCFLLGVANYLLDEQGEQQGYIIASNDVTELSFKQRELERAKEEAELANQHKNRFLARMSHELRTPMNAIIGLNDITQSRLTTSPCLADQQELHSYLENLKHSSLHLLDLLNDILEASNLESGTVTMVEKPLDLSVMVNDMIVKMQQKCAAKNLTWTTQLKFNSHRFSTDGLRLQQVLNHLFDNAVKFTPSGGKITFTVEQKDIKNDKVLIVFSIQDTGVGVPAHRIATLCNPFEQVEGDKYTSSGSGLGLSIVQKILELFGAQLTIQSEEGKGSEFSFGVWLQENKTAEKADWDTLRGRFIGQKALVVDDVYVNRIVLVNLLNEAGFVTDEAKDGKEGADMFAISPENTYSIIFMDIQMPVMDGWESAKAIRSLTRQDVKTLPIVTISANAFRDDVEKSLASGMNAHYAKPVQKDTVGEILMRFCTPKDQ